MISLDMPEDIEKLVIANDILERLPYILSRFRVDNWYSQREVARAVGCHINTLASFERGEQKISYKLAAAFIQWMIDAEREEKQS